VLAAPAYAELEAVTYLEFERAVYWASIALVAGILVGYMF
jgi:hypothetical protein